MCIRDRRYSVQAALLDPEALGSFPQEIISIDRTGGGPVYEIVTYGGEDKFCLLYTSRCV